jgi:hypothetical protein
VGQIQLTAEIGTLSSQPASSESPRAGLPPDAEEIRAQLNRLLAHPLFTNSKRYPVLLAYTVEQTLLGNAGELKERTIGVEAFGRSPDYDVNLDPVVRTSAAEVRRRLIQYYYDPARAGELIIELSAGSYVPAFRKPEPAAANAKGAGQEQRQEQKPEQRDDTFGQTAGLNPASIEVSAPSSSSAGPSLVRGIRRRLPIALSSLLALLLAMVAGIGIGRYHRSPPPSNLDRFWQPITSSQNPITYCLGAPSDLIRKRMPGGEPVAGGLDVSDVTTLARTIVPLVPRHRPFRVLSASDATFAQLREGPIVLIGAFDNAWTMRISQNLRFGFDETAGARKLVDRKNPQRFWTVQRDGPGGEMRTDYAIVARIHDSVTGQPVIITAGILGQGTEAASEVLYNPTYLDAMLAKAPENWDGKNLEAVIETQVIEGNPGPPEILDVESW